MKQDFYTVTELAAALGLAHRTILDRINAGKIVASKMGKQWLVSGAEVERLKLEPRVTAVQGPRDGAAEPRVQTESQEPRNSATSVDPRVIAADETQDPRIRAADSITTDPTAEFIPSAEDLKTLWDRMLKIHPGLTKAQFEKALARGWDMINGICDYYLSPLVMQFYNRLHALDNEITWNVFIDILSKEKDTRKGEQKIVDMCLEREAFQNIDPNVYVYEPAEVETELYDQIGADLGRVRFDELLADPDCGVKGLREYAERKAAQPQAYKASIMNATV